LQTLAGIADFLRSWDRNSI